MEAIRENRSQSEEQQKKELLSSLGTLAEKNLEAYEHAIIDFRSSFSLGSREDTLKRD